MTLQATSGRRLKRLYGCLVFLALLALESAQAQTGTPHVPSADRWAVLAHRIVLTSAAVKPGEAVVISGGKHTIPLMEALSIETQKAGGFPTMLLSSDSVTRSLYRDVPEKYLAQEPRFFGTWVRAVQVWISLPTEEDFAALVAGVPEARVAKAAEASQFIAKVANESGIRYVSVDYPSRGEAASNGMPYADYERLQWAGIGADYSAIGKQGDRIKAALQGAKTVRVTTPDGTDLTFTVGDRHVTVDDGRVTEEEAKGPALIERVTSLPGGSVILAPVETSGEGKVVAPKDRCRDVIVVDERFDVHGGTVSGLGARKGAKCLSDAMHAYSGPADRLGSFSIGLNPALHPVPASVYYPSRAAGVVYLFFGGNKFLGGDNDTPGGFSVALANATVTCDGKTLVKAGRVVAP